MARQLSQQVRGRRYILPHHFARPVVASPFLFSSVVGLSFALVLLQAAWWDGCLLTGMLPLFLECSALWLWRYNTSVVLIVAAVVFLEGLSVLLLGNPPITPFFSPVDS